MAKPSEILGAEFAKGTIRKGSAPYEVWDTTQGLTNELRDANIMEILGNTLLLKDAEYNPDATVPSLADVTSFFGLKNSKDKSAADQFLELFPSKVQQWKKKAESDPKWGKRGWETIKKIYQGASMDKMAEEINQAREKAMHDAPLRIPGIGEVADPFPDLSSFAAEMVAPRSVAAVREGRDPEANEWVRDAISNAAYAIPVSRILGSATKAAPVIARNIAQGAGQVVVPAAVATMDNIVDDSRDAGDWATDVALGSMANLGVNKVLGPWAANKIGALSGKVSRRGGMAAIRDVLEGSPTPEQKAADLVSAAKATKKADSRSLSAGMHNYDAPITKNEMTEAYKILDVASTPDAVMLNPNGTPIVNKATGKPLTGKDAAALIEEQLRNDYLAHNAEDVYGSIVQQATNPRTAANPTSDAFKKGAKDYKAIFTAHPELKSMFANPEPFLTMKPSWNTVSNAGAPLMAYAVNQAGSSIDEAANVIGNNFGMGSVKEIRAKNKARKDKAAHPARITEILGGPAITAEDEKWLSKVKDHPEMLQYGDPDDPEGFKRWLLSGGNDMLRGTPMYRPAWEVE